MSAAVMQTETDVLVIGSGAAGMYAAIEAARGGASVLVLDRSLIGRGGATVMAQMTVAVALGSETPDHWSHHYDDTLNAGRGICSEPLARLLCEQGPDCIREMDEWGVGWARKNGRIAQAMAPGHDRPRCVYVDFLSTGPAVSKTLRSTLYRISSVRRAGDMCVIDLIKSDGEVTGAVAWHVGSGMPVVISAKATIIATGGLTRLFRRNSASANMGGDGYALALRAGAPLVDMEFVQFFPIGHLAPRLIGMDPIMWDPFRYKLGGKLLNNRGEEFAKHYGVVEDGKYVITRDVGTYAILKEVEAGRGSPHGGVYLSFQHCPESALREAFGPVIDRLAKNNIDLTKMPVEVAPIAHYHMGGVVADARMETQMPGLLVAGEAVGGANGANRLSGNAITEALVYGRRAGRSAAEMVKKTRAYHANSTSARETLDLMTRDAPEHKDAPNTAAMVLELQATMAEDVGALRTQSKLEHALTRIDALATMLGDSPLGDHRAFDLRRLEWFDLRNMLLVARTVAEGALARTESRGAHQREDYPGMLPQWQANQVVRLKGSHLEVAQRPVRTEMAAQ
ncbi:MAG TPA: FAD-binding protein [Xanthobacteraceae bacterium]|nr:FAD-binding protein [Xanthobacteraceae bacterium]